MSTYISNRELAELGEGLTRHYLEQAHIHMAARCIDIEGLANYLGMTVVFETFAEEDRDKVGFLADGRTPLKIRRKGSIVSFCFPLGTFVLDTFLRQEKESGRRRFTIAHEIAHHVIDRHNPVPQFHRVYDSEHGYTMEELKAHLTIAENQADRLAAVILIGTILSFISVKKMAKLLCGLAAAGFGGAVFTAVSVAAIRPVNGLLDVRRGAGVWIVCAAFTLCFTLNLIVFIRGLPVVYREGDPERVAMGRRYKKKEITLAEIPFPIYQTEEERRAREQAIAETSAKLRQAQEEGNDDG